MQLFFNSSCRVKTFKPFHEYTQYVAYVIIHRTSVDGNRLVIIVLSLRGIGTNSPLIINTNNKQRILLRDIASVNDEQVGIINYMIN